MPFGELSLGLGLAPAVAASGASLSALALDFTDMDASGLSAAGVTFARASTATRVNSSGLIETVASGAPRFDHDPTDNSSLGLLIEEQRTNLCLYSSDLTNAAWTASNCTTAKTATGPDGVSNSATTVTASAGNATILQAITSASAARITSCWIKRRTGSGTINMTQDNGSTWAAVTVTASWARVNVNAATAANPTVGLQIVTSGDAVDVAYFQHEVGSFITSVIPTAGSTATRAADSASMTGTDFSDWYNASEGTFVVEAAGSGGSAPVIYAVTDSGNFASNFTYLADRNSFSLASEDGGVSQVNANIAGLGGTSFKKSAVAYKENDYGWSIDGGAVGADTSATLPTVDRLYLGGPTFLLNGHIKSLTYYDTRKSDTELQELTA